MRSTTTFKRFGAALATVSALSGVAFVPASQGDLQSQISKQQSQVSGLQSKISSDSATIQRASGGVAETRTELNSVQGQLNTDVTKLKSAQTQLMEARDKLTKLETQLHNASSDLSSNLVNQYETGAPTLMTAVVDSHGFNQLLNQVNFARKISANDAHVVGVTRAARTEVMAETNRLGALEQRDRTLTDSILSRRNKIAALQHTLLTEEINAAQDRSGARSQLAPLQKKLSVLQAKQAAIARQSAQQQALAVNRQAGVAINTSNMSGTTPNEPQPVKQMIAAGNAIATLPYIWGGGHGSFVAPGYDCSGSVSYVLAAAGLLSSPMVSGDFESWGQPGPGKWVTIYASGDHVWMTIAGRRFDTVALSSGGTRWASGGGEFAGMTVRHPPGL
ncbi:MAG: hypothetical protein J2O48_09880 [Solirubrobacterales bacterium]|nr:hypothetical protein [Solirubrobacterales bacterium]